jgi:cation transport protein ChaC
MAQDRWVFGYGSLMWRPGFPFAERRGAALHGRRRAFCIYSVHHRGTYERPGLVLGLAPGGACRGAAYRVADADWDEAYAYLLEREQPTETYIEARRHVRLDDGRRVEALCFLSDVHHRQWAGALSLERQAETGNPRHPGMGSNASATGATAPVPPARATTQMLGAGSFGQSAGLENVLNSGTPPAWDRKAGVRKVCPPELENRNNVCSPPMGSILSR